MIHQVNTHKQVFVVWIRYKILPNKQDFDGEFETKGEPMIKTTYGKTNVRIKISTKIFFFFSFLKLLLQSLLHCT